MARITDGNQLISVLYIVNNDDESSKQTTVERGISLSDILNVDQLDIHF